MDKLLEVMRQFQFEGDYVEYEVVNSGNINQTYCVSYRDADRIHKYTLQKLNTHVFKKPVEVMENILAVTEHLKVKTAEQYGSYERHVLSVVHTVDDKPYLDSPELGFWRAFVYVDGARGYDSVEKPEHFYMAGKAFGEFQQFLADFPAQTLYETIPNFHNTPARLETFRKAVEEDRAGRAHLVQEEIRFILDRAEKASTIMRRIDAGEIPVRVTHNDTKLNNILIDDETGAGICVIDLDTVMPGTPLFDFGDAVRYGASTAAEDEEDLQKVGFNMELYELFSKGFVTQTRGFLSDREIELLPLGAYTMAVELASRFLADYLDGDVYFKVTKPDHNLYRTRTQIKLAKIMEEKEKEMNDIVLKYLHA